ncbi:trigger factor [Candidatus Vallotia tarda]|uniref:Trigger factor n=1 Tax=Candidatus Vallotiella hemipterorum TaxID=1177213 RepID=A0A916NMD7_9BURK|nr:trigger factor [Candidatus Vallotia tarda]CAG7601907.1 Trigger factor [Candidatus Vallotia tarda]
MANVVENLGKLQRRVTITLPKKVIQKEIDERIRKLAKNVRISGFRPGKVPLKTVTQRYASQLEIEVLRESINKEFLYISGAKSLRVVEQPSISINKESTEGDAYVFDATFEVYPEVKLSNISGAEIQRKITRIGDSEIDRTIKILHKQRIRFCSHNDLSEPGRNSKDISAQSGDRITIDLVSKIDGKVFPGGSSENLTFILGEGQILPEFERATLGLKVGESKKFDLKFPDDYYSQDIASKTACFTIIIKKIEWPNQLEIDSEFAKSLGIVDGDLTKMRSEIKDNLEREVKRRTQAILKNQVMNALLRLSDFDIPNSLIEQDQQRLIEISRQELARRGVLASEKTAISTEIFKQRAERRVKLSLILSDLVKNHKLEAKPKQIQAVVNEFSKSHEDPEKVAHWYYSDQQRLAEIEAYVVENNVVDFVLGKANVTDKEVSFEELMKASQEAEA